MEGYFLPTERGGVATLVEDTDNFGAVIGDAIEDRVGMNRHGVYAAHQFGALAPCIGVLDDQIRGGASSITRASAISGEANFAVNTGRTGGRT